ncbi:hypothetical protein ElyMa_004986000 [Elysia marginata]|uniref:Uncharacterized protein n=1 Tax=Elysia marginata TaxID=1093978 RepID=A0AAV4J5F7_9GAST|nr:hypothetical protein ElyMa_004986000 [Elysia marginata]
MPSSRQNACCLLELWKEPKKQSNLFPAHRDTRETTLTFLYRKESKQQPLYLVTEDTVGLYSTVTVHINKNSQAITQMIGDLDPAAWGACNQSSHIFLTNIRQLRVISFWLI